MLAESPISLDRVAWSGQTGRPAVDSRHHDHDRGQVHLCQTQIVAYANSDPSSWSPRNEALGNRSRPPGVRNPSQRAGLKPIRHGPAHWTRSRCGQPKSLTRSLAGCGSPLNDQLTPKALFHQASLRSDRLVRPHGVMSSVALSCPRISPCLDHVSIAALENPAVAGSSMLRNLDRVPAAMPFAMRTDAWVRSPFGVSPAGLRGIRDMRTPASSRPPLSSKEPCRRSRLCTHSSEG